MTAPKSYAESFSRSDALPDFDGALVVGVDEAGRGPLAGPVVAAAVILPAPRQPRRYRDSKQLDAETRTRLRREITDEAVAWATGRAEVREIDEINVLNASLLAMARAVNALGVTPELVLVDGNRAPDVGLPCWTIVGGDDRVEVISAASIVAKVERDEEMLRLHQRYPAYNFASHKGYPTPEHLRALERYGACDVHRRSYRPVRESLAAAQAGRGVDRGAGRGAAP